MTSWCAKLDLILYLCISKNTNFNFINCSLSNYRVMKWKIQLWWNLTDFEASDGHWFRLYELKENSGFKKKKTYAYNGGKQQKL